MKNNKYTCKKGFISLAKTSKMRTVAAITLALVLQSVVSISYAQNVEIYSDGLGDGLVDASNFDGTLEFNSTNQPKSGDSCILWADVVQYGAITLDFDPDIDLSELAKDGYSLDFYVRGAASTNSEYSFNIRFVDTKTGDDDHPWRNLITIDNTVATWDGQWHHVQILLSDFSEQGSWDDAWYSPQGLYDWSAVDKIEIVGETLSMSDGDSISFDDIYICKDGVTEINDLKSGFVSVSYDSNHRVLLKNESGSEINLSLIDLSGRTVLSDRFANSQYVIDGAELESAVYILRMQGEGGQCCSQKICIR